MPKIEGVLDMSDLEVRNMLLHKWTTAGRPTTAEARIGYNTTLNCPEWHTGAQWAQIYPATAGNVSSAASAANGTGFVDNLTDSIWSVAYGETYTANLAKSADGFCLGVVEPAGSGGLSLGGTIIGVFEGFLDGVAKRSCGFATDAPLTIGLTGKATAAAIEITDTGGLGESTPTYNINVTALSVAAGDISLTDDYIIVGNESNVGSAVARNTIPLSDWGAAGANISLGGNRITSLADPVSDTDAANKQWTLSVIALGNAPKTAVRISTTAALAAYTYSGPSPRKLVANSAGAFPAIDGVTLSLNDRILVRHESGANEKYNGVYTLTVVGDGSNPWELTRGVEEDTDSEVVTGIAYFVTSGTLYGGTEWTLATAGTITLDTTALAFVQTGGSNAYVAGNGIVISGTTMHFGQSGSYTANQIPYATGAASIGFIGAGAAYQSLRIPGGGGAPAFGAIDISQSAAVTGALDEANGGTGHGSYTVGDLLQASASGVLAKLAAVAVGNVLLSGGVGTVSAWGKVGLTTHVSGTLPVGSGGTGATTHTANGLLMGNGTSAVSAVSTASSGAIIVTASGGVPTFVVPPGSGDVTIATTGTMTIGANKVSLAKMAQVTGPTWIGRQSGVGNVAELTPTQVKEMLDLDGENTGDQTITLTGDVTGTGTGSFAASIASGAVVEAKIGTGAVTEAKIGSGAVTNAKIRQGAALSVIGVAGASTTNVADIAAGTVGSASANKVFRINNAGDAIEWGALNLASTNAVTGTLPVANGGTGTNVANLFPTVSGGTQIAGIAKYGLASGSSSYDISNPFGNTDVIVQVFNASGTQVFPDISRTSTNVVVAFGATTAVSYRVIITGNNLS